MNAPHHIPSSGRDDSAQRIGAALPSLFVLSLPRSLSSVVHERARAALGLQAPAWTSAGEILNVGRWRMLAEECTEGRYEHDAAGARFDVWQRFLHDTVRPHGHAYKNVVQPFACAHWLAQGRGRALRVLCLHRPVADVAWSMLKAGWRYPQRAASAEGDDTDRLLRAQQALSEVDGVELAFDAIGPAPDALSDALRRLYPEATLPTEGTALMTDRAFAARFNEMLQRRSTPLWRTLDARIRDCEALQPV